MRPILWVAPIFGFLAGCAPDAPRPVTSSLTTPAAAQVGSCEAAPARWADTGNGQCLAVDSHGVARSPTLVVVLHGDLSSGGPATYHRELAQRIAEALPASAVYSIVRPGYPAGDGRISAGDSFGRRDHYTRENMQLVAEAIRTLKRRTGASRVVAVGHSGGAATAANIMSLHQGVIDASALIACPCALGAWRIGSRPWGQSIDPFSVTGTMPTSARIVAFTGDRDSNTRTALAADYVALLRRNGVTARFVPVPAAGHNDVVEAMWSHGFGSALAELAAP